jgi:hypothetical protein
MANETISKIGKSFKKILRWALVVLIIILAVVIYWKYFYTYSDGYRAGLLQKFSHKGTIFKTYEGELILSSVVSNANVPLASEKFFFSVTDDSLATKLDTLQGQFLIIHYKEKNGVLFWKGDTKYIVDGAKVKK